MSEPAPAALHAWVVAPLKGQVLEAIERLRRAPDVRHVAVMPDVHLAEDVCIGVAVGTTQLIYPQAVGGDIGCGMLAVPFDAGAERLADPATAAQLLARIARAVPARRRNRRAAIGAPAALTREPLSDPRLDTLWRRDGVLEFGTVGGGNHFCEIQADSAERLWLMVHSGSRIMGPAIRDHHLGRARAGGGGLRALAADSAEGCAYLNDAAWARGFAAANRAQIARSIAEVMSATVGATPDWVRAISTDHNHVAPESYGGRSLWVHRKGAMAAPEGRWGVLPGSMGTVSFHVQGRGCAAALCSSAHGAGRLMSRTEARRRVSVRELRRQMAGIWYDYRQAEQLRDEAPSAYKDIRAVARAQRELVTIARVLRPLLNYKGA